MKSQKQGYTRCLMWWLELLTYLTLTSDEHSSKILLSDHEDFSSYSHEKMLFPIKFDEHNPMYKALVVSKLRVELSVFPTEAVDEFFDEHYLQNDFEVKQGRDKNESTISLC